MTARADLVERAARRHMFRRALRAEVTAPSDLAERTGAIMRLALVRSLSLLRKAGELTAGAGKVEAMVRGGEAAMILHAAEAAPDGVRKIAQARHAAKAALGLDIPAESLFTAEEMGLAFGGDHVIHAAVRAGDAGKAFVGRLDRYRSYCGDGERGAEKAGREASAFGEGTPTDASEGEGTMNELGNPGR